MNQFNALHGDETNKPTREWNIKPMPPPAHFESRTSPPKTSPVVSTIMGRLNNYSIDNGGVEVNLSYLTSESNYESVPYPDTTPIKSIDYGEIDHLLEIFHS